MVFHACVIFFVYFYPLYLCDCIFHVDNNSKILISIVFNVQVGKRVVMFSYGSGLTATMFSFRLQEGQQPFNLSNIVKLMNVSDKLKQRIEVCHL